MVRKPAVAGYFYPENPQDLRTMIQDLFASPLGPGGWEGKIPYFEKITGVVSPHAGYLYSGAIACWSYSLVARAQAVETFVIIGPNHRGIGQRVALSGDHAWLTPLGEVGVDQESTAFLSSEYPFFSIDSQAHQYEHSLEVQLPFLQFFVPYQFEILPICLIEQNLNLAISLAQALDELSRRKKIMLIASSDFSHYEPAEVAQKKDKLAISKILSLDLKGFFAVLQEKDISICGPGGIAALMGFHKLESTRFGELISYSHSGAVSGDLRQVVGYASLAFPT
ncbi:MAG: hypothetical protein PWP04_1134 [Candidatus Atribacteria bacterium]|nr:hypothetical protein [Candidatus Atribacteria bacterium]